jgi:hypothetical protein
MHMPIHATVRRFISPASLALLLAVGACGGNDDRGVAGDAPATDVTAQNASRSATTTSASATSLEIRISGGQHAGTHQVSDNVSCTVDPGTWMVTASRPGDQGLTQVLLLLEGVQPTGGSSGEVSLMAQFGDPMSGTGPNSGSISLDPAGGEGTGSGTVRREGRGAVIELNGTTSDGAQVSAVIRCATVAGSS